MNILLYLFCLFGLWIGSAKADLPPGATYLPSHVEEPPASPIPSAATCSMKQHSFDAYEVGLSVRVLLPNRLTDFSTSLPAYGPMLGVPIGNDTLYAEALYGGTTLSTGNNLSLFILEAGYRLNFTTPFFSGFLLGGVHFLHYSLSGHATHELGGGNGGLGFRLSMSKDFAIDLAMKVYFQDRAIVTFGGGFTFLL